VLRAGQQAHNRGPAMYSLLWLIDTVIQIYVYILIASAVLSWLIAFNVVNTRNSAVAIIADVLYRLTEPVLRPIRRFMPNFGGLDLSPVVLILLLYFADRLIHEIFFRVVVGG
jgi:YggT family protein